MAGRLAFGLAAGCAAAACAFAAVMVGRRVRSRRRWGKAVGILKEFEEGCSTSTARLRQVVNAMAVEMHAGLASDGGSKLKMLPTFVDNLPDGSEKGTYYSLDLGGTNFRILRAQLGGRWPAVLRYHVERQQIPQELMTGTSEELFSFLARALKLFVEKDNLELGEIRDKEKELGFTFSFPIRQMSVSSGILIKWTKGFEVEDAVGEDIARCMEEAAKNEGLEVRIAALVNNTVGTLALGHYHDEDTVAAIIIGTGTNACYVERTDAIIKYQGLLTNSGGMVINMEWGNFWSSHLPRTSYDIALDDESPNRSDQGFEKMISGMYLGDIARRVLLRMAQESDIFGDAAHHLSEPFILRTPLMCAMHEDDTPDLREVGRILHEDFKIRHVPIKVRRLVVRVCDAVTQRAARLVAAGIVGILKKIGRDGRTGERTRGRERRSVVAIEGGLYAGHAMFREYLNEAVVEILGEDVARNVILRLTEDGSGLGAALLAASHSKNR